MIEIKCNKTEKKKIIDALKVMDSPCLFPKKQSICPLDIKADCEKCLNSKIKWIADKSNTVLDKAVNDGFLKDWYINSVDDRDEPVWTDKHIAELANDFIIIPKSSLN
jgi:hypothetical protein